VLEIEGSTLIIRDLGYINVRSLKEIIKRTASFLCRLHTSADAYEIVDGKRQIICFKKLYETMRHSNLERMEKTVLIGHGKDEVMCRLIIVLLPDTIVEQRLRHTSARKKHKKRSAVISDKYRYRARFNLFITNAPATLLPMDIVDDIYAQRWQIELLFKSWKSICNIDKVKKVNRFRLECYMYAKLILIMLCWKTIWSLRIHAYRSCGLVVSIQKGFQRLYRFAESLRGFIGYEMDLFHKTIQNIIQTVGLLELEKHGQDATSMELMCLSSMVES
jgi:hypothetical protein